MFAVKYLLSHTQTRIHHWQIQGGALRKPPRPIFFEFDALFGKTWPK